jgi:hypothetical protein
LHIETQNNPNPLCPTTVNDSQQHLRTHVHARIGLAHIKPHARVTTTRRSCSRRKIRLESLFIIRYVRYVRYEDQPPAAKPSRIMVPYSPARGQAICARNLRNLLQSAPGLRSTLITILMTRFPSRTQRVRRRQSRSRRWS